MSHTPYINKFKQLLQEVVNSTQAIDSQRKQLPKFTMTRSMYVRIYGTV